MPVRGHEGAWLRKGNFPALWFKGGRQAARGSGENRSGGAKGGLGFLEVYGYDFREKKGAGFRAGGTSMGFSGFGFWVFPASGFTGGGPGMPVRDAGYFSRSTRFAFPAGQAGEGRWVYKKSEISRQHADIFPAFFFRKKGNHGLV